MSRRFGRNQKRALIKQAEQLRDALAMSNGLTADQRATISLQDESLRRVADLLGPYFAGLPPRNMPAREIPREWRIPGTPRATAATVYEQIDTLRVHTLKFIDAESFVDKLSGRMHIKVETPLGVVAYGFTESCFDGMPPSEAAYYLGKQMAQHLLSKRVLENPYE